jgi:hypothetical protein
MPADVLSQYHYDKRIGQYRSDKTGKFVGRKTIVGLMRDQVGGAEDRFGALTTAYYEGKLSAATWIEAMQTEQRRLTLQNAALGAGGWDRLTQAQYGRAGADLRQIYAKISGTARDIADGKITLAQALARANEYVGSAKAHFWEADRESLQASDTSVVILERRVLHGDESCKDCVEYYDKGWQYMGQLPVPCQDSVCGGHCKCTLERTEVPANEVDQWLGTKK